MTAYEGLIIGVRILAFIWAIGVGYFVAAIAVPYTLWLIEENRWQRLHPGWPPRRPR